MKYVKISDTAYTNGQSVLWIDYPSHVGDFYKIRLNEATIYRTGKHEVAELKLEEFVKRLNMWDGWQSKEG